MLEHDITVSFAVRPLVEGLEIVATYPDAQYDRGQGPTFGAAFHDLYPKLADAFAELVSDLEADIFGDPDA